jgi:hypothetical protein
MAVVLDVASAQRFAYPKKVEQDFHDPDQIHHGK